MLEGNSLMDVNSTSIDLIVNCRSIHSKNSNNADTLGKNSRIFTFCCRYLQIINWPNIVLLILKQGAKTCEHQKYFQRPLAEKFKPKIGLP